MSFPERSRPASPGHLFVRSITILNVLAVLMLFANGWLDYAFSGSQMLDSDSQPPVFERATYGLLGYRYWGEGYTLTGPHRPLTWAVLWLLLVTLAWAGQVWYQGRAFRRGLGVSVLSLLLVLLTCAVILPVAGSAHTRFLQHYNQGTVSIGASITRLEAVVYLPCDRPQDCGQSVRTASVFVNPFVLSLVAIALGGLLSVLPRRAWTRRPA